MRFNAIKSNYIRCSLQFYSIQSADVGIDVIGVEFILIIIIKVNLIHLTWILLINSMRFFFTL